MNLKLLRIPSLALMFLVLLAGAGCNTIEGAGEDIEAGGKVISETAEDTRDEID